MMKIFKRFRNEEKGATAIEYGLLAAMIGVAIIVGASTLGTALNDQFTAVSGCLGELHDGSGSQAACN